MCGRRMSGGVHDRRGEALDVISDGLFMRGECRGGMNLAAVGFVSSLE
jgi:hypothetical protein